MKLKKQIIDELSRKGFPNMKFLFSEEVLDVAIEVLRDLLKEERHKFNTLLLTPTTELTFNSFEEDSLLDYFWGLLNHLDNVNSTDKIRKLIENFRPELQDFSHEVSYSRDYFEHLLYVQKNCELDSEEERIMYLRIKAFKDRGIDLRQKDQEKLKNINKKLSKLSDKFDNNIIDEEKTVEYVIYDFESIKDLPKTVLEKTKKAYIESKHYSKGKKEGYLFDADPTSFGAIMKYCSDKKVRKDFEFRGNNTASSGKYDNREVVLDSLKYKREKAEILGYKNYAELSLNAKMADSPEQILDLVEDISKVSKLKAEKELKELADYYNLEKLETCDVAYYSRKYKEEKYSFSEEELKKYFEFDSVLDYLHRFIEKFYGIEIRELDIEVYEDGVRAYEIYRGDKLISYYFLDPFYRKLKNAGAWANNLREKTYISTNKVPVVLNVANFTKPESGKITLYLREVETIFHEFGHAIHEIVSESKHSELSGFQVDWDFIELPSQLLENWCNSKESIVKLAKHVDTGESIPLDMVNKLEQLKKYMAGYSVARQTEFTLLDMILFVNNPPKSIKELDKNILEIINKHSIFSRGKDYKMYCNFHHIFAGAYAAGFYSYMRAEILEADIFARIKEMGMFDPKTGKKFLKTILGQGTKKEASELFQDFMGREVDNTAFMERYGLK